MPPKNDILTAELSKNLELTHQLVVGLIRDLREDGIDFVQLKLEVKALVDNFKALQEKVNDHKDDVAEFKLKIALLERYVEELKQQNKEKEKATQEMNAAIVASKSSEKQGKWQAWAAVGAGLIGLIASIIAIVFK